MADDIYRLSSDIVDETAAMLPTLATYLGIAGHDHRWDDFSVEGQQAAREMFERQLQRVEAIAAADDPWERLARDVALEEIRRSIDYYEHGEYLLDLNSLASPLQDMRDTFDTMPKESEEAWQNIASRLHALPGAMQGYLERLEFARRQGEVVARRQVVEAARQAGNHAGDRSHFDTFSGALAAAGIGSEELARGVAEGVEKAKAAFASAAKFLEADYLASAKDEDAVGEERYRRKVRRYLGADIDPHATYEWGWAEVERLRHRMAETAEEILPGGSLSEALELLLTDPERAAVSQEEFRTLMQERQTIALDELAGVHFDIPDPIRSVAVKMTPPGGSLGAYYESPSEDFSRPGTIWWSKGDQQQIPLFDEVTTAYHEGFPGHHLQVGLQLTAGDRFSRFHRLMVWYSGSGEGWALYAEDLMEELGYLEKPDYVMGKLASEMLRACRVVIDIGSHLRLTIPDGQPFHPGEPWSFELGVEMLERYAAQDHDIAVSEMNRYLGWPGQAISYKLGQQAIRDMRNAERDRLGDGYDQKTFHARLLEVGAVGLDLLRSHMGYPVG